MALQPEITPLAQNKAALFTRFDVDISAEEIPNQFTFPFYYQPHPLCVLAAEQLQQQLLEHEKLQAAFDLSNASIEAIGKMFGVLIVRNAQGELGFISAFSGDLLGSSYFAGFVPPVFDFSYKDSDYLEQQKIINDMNAKITALESNPELNRLSAQLQAETQAQTHAIEQFQAQVRENRIQRKLTRAALENHGEDQESAQVLASLNLASIAEKKHLKALKQTWQENIANIELPLEKLNADILQLKKRRKNLSNKLQKIIFKQYTFLNIHHESKNLSEIFRDTTSQIPPAGAGECAAPKLLQYAFKNELTPIAMAEFWWGRSPKSAIRRHGNYYPSCYSKCQPILKHMLSGMNVTPNPLLINPAENQQFEVLYQDDAIVVINKPAEFLSVPGINIQDSVYTRMKTLYPNASGPIIVHRLDMSTSGLMVLTLNKLANKKLQQQFIKRTVTKRYVALLEGLLPEKQGTISLPLRLDLDDKPRQLVCYQHGKNAETYFEVITENQGRTKVYFYPKTGRTHQLRVHAAHQLGLNAPIVGDDHYGKQANRLHLHAESLSFQHPITKEEMHFQCDADF